MEREIRPLSEKTVGLRLQGEAQSGGGCLVDET